MAVFAESWHIHNRRDNDVHGLTVGVILHLISESEPIS